MENQVEVRIYYDGTEVKKAISYFLLKVKNMQMVFMITMPVIALAVIYAMTQHKYLWLAPFLVAGGFLFYDFYYKRIVESYEKFYKKTKGGTYRFSDENVFISGEDVQSTVSWSVYRKSYEIPSAFLLMDNNQFIYVFPKSCFEGAEAIQAIRHQLKNKMPNFEVRT